mgnify:CR=1 FL=1
MKFLRHRRAADHLAALDHLSQPGHREIGRAGEAVMARADDDNVGFCHGRFKNVAVDYRHSGMVRKHQTRIEIPGSARS